MFAFECFIKKNAPQGVFLLFVYTQFIWIEIMDKSCMSSHFSLSVIDKDFGRFLELLTALGVL